MFGQQGRGEHHSVLKRREMEDRRATDARSVRQDATLRQIATWEHKTDSRIQRNQFGNMVRTLQKQDEQTLQERRRRLASLLQRDDEMYRQELSGLQETSTQRARRMVANARSLKQQREEERKAFCQEQYNRQWREGCDDLRGLNSEKLKDHCISEIASQRVQKQERQQQEIQEEARWADEDKREIQKKLEREQNEARYRQQKNAETRAALDDQVTVRRTRKETEDEILRREGETFRENVRREKEHLQKEQYMHTLRKHEKMQRIKKFNEDNRRKKIDDARREREEELRDLQEQLAQHREETRYKAEEKQKARQDIAEYQAYLRLRKKEESFMEQELERLCAEEQARANAKRDVQWEAEAKARKDLARDVYYGRLEQLSEKEQRRQQEEMEIAREREIVEQRLQHDLRLQEEEEYAQIQKERALGLDLERQIAEKQHRSAISDAERRKEHESALAAERQYSAFMNREKQAANTSQYAPRSHGLKTVIWD